MGERSSSRCITLAIILLIATGSARPAHAADREAAAPPNGGQATPQVTIEASRERLMRRTHEFVSGITHNNRFSSESMERWHNPLCFSVAGLTRDQAAFILNRLSNDAADAGATLAKEHCKADLAVIFSSDPPAVMRRLRALNASRGLLGRRKVSAVDLDRFSKSPHPVKVWYETELVKVPVGASRMSYGQILNLTGVIIVVDSDRVKGLPIGAVADYIAMVGLTDVNQDANLGEASTILRLFAPSADPPVASLTRWDKLFLRELYLTDQSSVLQRSSVADRIAIELAKEQPLR